MRTLNRPEYRPIQQHVAVLKGGELINQLQQDGVAVSNFAGTGYMHRLWGIIQLLQDFRPDIIHTRLSSAGYWLRAAALMSGHKPILIHAHGGQTFYQAGLKRRFLEKFLDRFTTKHVCVSESIKRHLLLHGFKEHKLCVILNGICQDRIGARPDRPFSHPPKLLCLGRLERVKGQDILLESLAKLKARGVDFWCDFAGEGSQREEFMSLASRLNLTDRVVFLGNKPDIGSSLAGYDLFIQPSRSEGLSLALIEAMTAGLPIVASAVGESERILSGYGSLVKPEDVEGLAKAINIVLTNSDAALAKAHQARSLAHQYSTQTMAEHYVTLFVQSLTYEKNKGGR